MSCACVSVAPKRCRRLNRPLVGPGSNSRHHPVPRLLLVLPQLPHDPGSGAACAARRSWSPPPPCSGVTAASGSSTNGTTRRSRRGGRMSSSPSAADPRTWRGTGGRARPGCAKWRRRNHSYLHRSFFEPFQAALTPSEFLADIYRTEDWVGIDGVADAHRTG